MAGWRNIVIREKSALSVLDNQLCITANGNAKTVPIEQISHVLLESVSVTMSSAVVATLASMNVHIVLCGEKHLPNCEVLPIGQHFESSGCVIDQTAWLSENKDKVWKSIVEMKFRNQERLLSFTSHNPPQQFYQYMKTVETGDKTNREALGARLFFHSLFGQDFRRHHDDAINAKLNYGYTILCSSFSRIISLHGYHNGLGIHHCSRDNPVNFACDLMEPFRPLVDQMTYHYGERELDWDLRKEYISIPFRRCWLDGKGTSVGDASELFMLKTIEALRKGTDDLPEVRFV